MSIQNRIVPPLSLSLFFLPSVVDTCTKDGEEEKRKRERKKKRSHVMVSFTFSPLPPSPTSNVSGLLAFPPRTRRRFQVSGKIDFSRARVSFRVSTVKGTSNRFPVSIELEFLLDSGVFTILAYGIVNVSRRWKEEGLQIFLIIGFFRVGRMELTYWIRSIFFFVSRGEREKKEETCRTSTWSSEIGVNSQ